MLPPAFDAFPDRYEILGELGDGGMGMVFKARDSETGAIVALKTLRPELANEPAVAERFKNELLLARKITHRNVCRIYEFNRSGDLAYISMEYVEGETLRDLMKRRGALPPDEAVAIVRQLCAGLGEAHEQGVVHRDLKPENVMVDVTGHVKVMDFGIARSMDTRTNLTVGWVGTPAYMSPEQASGSSTTVRSDVYAVGLILYELLTGRATFSADTPVAVALKHMQERPQTPRSIDANIPVDLERIILRCLEKDPEARFASAKEVEQALSGAPVAPATLSRSRKPWSRRKWSVVAAAAVVGALVLANAVSPRRAVALKLPLSEYTLANGLHVILSEDHTAPTVGVSMMYRVGAQDDPAGQGGMAHLFEHMMFLGSENVAKAGHTALIAGVGGDNNGSTTEDRTEFYERIPSNQLELALFLESDRLRSLDISDANLDNARDVISEERRTRVTNNAYGKVGPTILGLAYDFYPYQHAPMGEPGDLDRVTVAAARAFHDKYYVASNAVLTIVGDFREDSALALVKRYFDALPVRPRPARASLSQPARSAERREVLADPFASSARIDVAYLTPGGNSADQAALDLAASLLGTGESSRLSQSLVRGSEMAAALGVASTPRMGPSIFYIVAQLRQGKTVEQAQQVLDSVIARLQVEPVSTRELAKAKLQARRVRVTSLELTTARASVLGESSVLFDNAAKVNDVEAAMERVTPEDIQRVAKKYLVPSNRVVVVSVPAPRVAAAPPAESERPAASAALAVRSEARTATAPIAPGLPEVHLKRPVQSTLPNGITAQVIEDHRLPQVLVSISVLGAGPLYEGTAAGVASLAAQMLRDGTTTRTGRQVADDFEQTGAILSASTAASSPIASVQALGLSGNFSAWMPILADVLMNPRFPADELNARRRRLVATVQQQRSTARFAADEQMAHAVYGSHPASQLAPPLAALDQIDASMLAQWHREHYAPQNTLISIIGDVSATKVRGQLEKWFSAWPRTQYTPAAPASPMAPANRAVMLIDRPGSSQSVLMVGGLAIDRRSPDYPAILVLNRILGGEPTVARLGFALREQKGYAYDAQSSFNTSSYPGLWRAWADVRTGVTDPALTILLAEVRRISAEPVPPAELERAKRSLSATFATSLEQSSQVLNNWITLSRFGFSDDYWDTFPEKIMAVTAEEVQQAARRYYDPARFQIVVVGDGARVMPILSRLGPVQRVEPPR